MPFKIVKGDITEMKVDAIVNAANTTLKMGGGVCGAIFLKAGPEELQKECDEIHMCPEGSAVITKGYRLKAKHIIHAVGPIWQGGHHQEEAKLRSAYESALNLAQSHDLESVAFPLISSGIYGYPKEEALRVAREAITDFLEDADLLVYLVIYDQKSLKISAERRSSIEKYLLEYYEHEQRRGLLKRKRELPEYYANSTLEVPSMASEASMESISLEDYFEKLEETFSERLLKLIDEKGYTDAQAYKKANISRQHFSKIRVDKDYKPSKTTAISFAIALELNLDETLDLLGRAGFTLSHSSQFDTIIEYFLVTKNYDIFEINESLFAYMQQTLT
ncbi:macro domain-containing protein [Proteiniclasticum sp. C24MP]|uniref:macro domain-containing protein n=1 Tax=Proteiniclasticum sp. C24MP TaxID=3374101 RepID=UPI00375433FC